MFELENTKRKLARTKQEGIICFAIECLKSICVQLNIKNNNVEEIISVLVNFVETDNWEKLMELSDSLSEIKEKYFSSIASDTWEKLSEFDESGKSLKMPYLLAKAVDFTVDCVNKSVDIPNGLNITIEVNEELLNFMDKNNLNIPDLDQVLLKYSDKYLWKYPVMRINGELLHKSYENELEEKANRNEERLR